jgi:hypothetical protein
MSPGHPTADGRTFGELHVGDRLEGGTVSAATIVDYDERFTFDILPDSDTGTYFAGGVHVGSTLARPR